MGKLLIDTVYVEESVRDHPRTQAVLARTSRATIIPCERYGEIFNRNAQSFRLQKQQPALILARKHDGFVLPSPSGCRLGSPLNYYFSHMLNCVYDCRYCFLQGMYRSAHYLLFVNYEDFWEEILKTRRRAPAVETMFFSGYDCDSLALEPTTGFVDFFLPLFDDQEQAWLELRTKCTRLQVFESRAPSARTVIAYSLSPELIAKHVEHRAPPVSRRIAALRRLAEQGWKVGLRFDPIILYDGWQSGYRDLIRAVTREVPAASIHSVSIGPMRFPRDMFKTISREYPDEPLFAGPLASEDGQMVSYGEERETEATSFVAGLLDGSVSADRVFVARWKEATT